MTVANDISAICTTGVHVMLRRTDLISSKQSAVKCSAANIPSDDEIIRGMYEITNHKSRATVTEPSAKARTRK